MPTISKQNKLNQIISDIKDRVKNAVKRNLFSKADIEYENSKKLVSFIQYTLVSSITRKDALDILSLLEYDKSASWDEDQSTYGKFECIEDIAAVDLLKYIQSISHNKFSWFLS